MHVNKVSHVKTVDRVAKELGEDVDWLHEVALDMDVEDGVIWVYDLDDDGVLAFTDFGVETLSRDDLGCKYHVVSIPKSRRKTLDQELRRHLGEVFRRLAFQKESKVEEGHLMPDHVHMLLSIPPKYAVSQVVGFIKGKSAIHMARVYGERKRNFVGQHFWARGFFVNTVGRDEEAIRAYIRNQETEDQRLEQMNLWR